MDFIEDDPQNVSHLDILAKLSPSSPHSEKREACEQLTASFGSRNDGLQGGDFSEDQTVQLIAALITANCVESVTLAADVLSGQYRSVAVSWFYHKDDVRRILDDLATTEPDIDRFRLIYTTEEGARVALSQLTTNYRRVVRHLRELGHANGLCSTFWVKLFHAPTSIYYAKLVNAFDQHMYISNCDFDGKLSFLHGLRGFLEKSLTEEEKVAGKQLVFEVRDCWSDLVEALSEAIDAALEQIEDGAEMAAEMMALLAASSCNDAWEPDTGDISPHGAVIQSIIQSIATTDDEDYQEAMFDTSVEMLLEIALQESPEKAALAGASAKPDCYPVLGAECRLLLFGDVGVDNAIELRPYANQLVAIYDKHKSASTEERDRMLNAFTSMYSKVQPALRSNFLLFFTDLFATNTYPLAYYKLLGAMAEHDSDVFAGQHVSRLVTRMGSHEEDVGRIMEILTCLANTNPALMYGRGQDYYAIACCSEDPDVRLQNVVRTNEFMVAVSRYDADEAERVVDIMFRAIETESGLRDPKVINAFLNSWRQISFTQTQPFVNTGRRTKLKAWAVNPATAQRAQLLLKLNSTPNTCSCIIIENIAESGLRDPKVINAFLNSWRQISFTQTQPFVNTGRRTKLKTWAENPATAQRAQLLLNSTPNTCSCTIL